MKTLLLTLSAVLVLSGCTTTITKDEVENNTIPSSDGSIGDGLGGRITTEDQQYVTNYLLKRELNNLKNEYDKRISDLKMVLQEKDKHTHANDGKIVPDHSLDLKPMKKEYTDRDNTYLTVFDYLEHGEVYVVEMPDGYKNNLMKSGEKYCVKYIASDTDESHTWGIWVTSGNTPREANLSNNILFMESPQEGWSWHTISNWSEYRCSSLIK